MRKYRICRVKSAIKSVGKRLPAVLLCIIMSLTVLTPAVFAVSGADTKLPTGYVNSEYEAETGEPPLVPSEQQEEGVIGEPVPAPSEQEREGETGEPVLAPFNRELGTGAEAPANTYALQVATGKVEGATIQYFAIRFIDTNGYARTEFVFPHEDSLTSSYNTAKKYGTVDTSEAVKDLLGYTTNETTLTGLKSNSLDTYLFTLEYAVDFSKSLDIEVFMHREQDNSSVKNEWTCDDVRFYSVERIAGLGIVGSYSSEQYIAFNGKLYAQFNKKQSNSGDFSVNEADRLFRLGSDKNAKYGLNVYKSDTAVAYDGINSGNNLTFRFDFADIYGAGIEALAAEYNDYVAKVIEIDAYKDSLFSKRMQLCEALCLTVKYEDIYGKTRTVKIPVITSSLYWLMSNFPEVAKGKYNGFAQQGDTIICSGVFPDYKKITGYTLYYGADAGIQAGVNGPTSARHSDRLKSITKNNDAINLVSLSIFESSRANAAAFAENAMLRCTTHGVPLYYYRSKTLDGFKMEPGNNSSIFSSFETVNAQDYKNTETEVTLLPKTNGETYIFEITTDDVDLADTTSEVSIGITYVTKDGYEKTVDMQSLKTLVRDYNGYWPAIGGSGSEFTYLSGVSRSGSLVFALNCSKLDYFKSLTFALEDGSTNEWQLGTISIYRVNSLPQRQCVWLEKDLSIGGITTDRMFSRAVAKENRIQYYEKKLLLTKEEPISTITFNGSGGSTEDVEDIDWESIKNSMSYNETIQDLGFTKLRYVYQVDVNVFGNVNADDTYGDCGSSNLFYFQLMFEEGTSPYVLANQQLTSDGFRAGEKESFYIGTNRDYGDVKSVRIIPDDTQGNEAVYDKLNIDNISVVQTSSGGTSRTWTFDDVGWIGIDYQDNGSEQSFTGKKLRTEAEMSSSFQNTGRGYSMNLLFAIATGQYEDGCPQYQGSLTATISYKKSDETVCTETVDVARLMGEYAGKVTYTGDDSGETKEKRRIDTSYMLRENRIDRFVVSLFDVVQVYSLTLHTAGTVSTVWPITSVDVYQIKENGPLILTSRGEYKRNGEFEHICSSDSLTGYQIQVTTTDNGEVVPQDDTIVFGDNTIVFDGNSMETTIERIPTSKNDSVNVYLYLDKALGTSQSNDFKCSVKYQKRDVDATYQLSIKDFTLSDDRKMLYAQGVNAMGMSAFYEMYVTSGNDLTLNHAIVQHIRDGVVIFSYYVSFGVSDNPMYGSIGVPLPRPDSTEEKQVLTLQFSDDTEYKRLSSSGTNVVVGFSYITKDDPANKVYNSANVYLTDQQIEEIKSGLTVDIVFHEMYVKEITKISVTATEQFTATVSKAMVNVYNTDNKGKEKCTAHYSIAEPILVTRTKRSANVTEKNVGAIAVQFETDSQSTYIGMENMRVSMKLGIENDYGDTREIVISDISNYFVSGGIKSGTVAEMRMLVTDIESVKYMVLTPHNPENGKLPGWPLKSVNVSWFINCDENGSGNLAASVGKVVKTEESFVINTAEVVVGATVKVLDKTGGGVITRSIEGKDIDLSIDDGYSVSFTPEAINSIKGFGCQVEAKHISGGDPNFTLLKKTDGGYIFVPAEQHKDTAVYTITVSSEEDPEKVININVSVEPSPVPETTTEQATSVPSTEVATTSAETTTVPTTTEPVPTTQAETTTTTTAPPLV